MEDIFSIAIKLYPLPALSRFCIYFEVNTILVKCHIDFPFHLLQLDILGSLSKIGRET